MRPYPSAVAATSKRCRRRGGCGGKVLRAAHLVTTVNRKAMVFVLYIMKAHRGLVVRVLPLLAVGLLALAGCSSAATPPPPASTVGGVTSAASFTIKAYKIPAFTASPGQKITLVDGDSEPHTVTADDNSFNSGSFDTTTPGSLVAPTKPGTYPVHCTVHPAMHGTLTVR